MAALTLLTGFPAPRACAVLRELLRVGSKPRVVLLVHAERNEEAQALLAQPDFASAELDVEIGDATAIDFGLTGARYLALARSVDVVHAAYSITDLGANESIAERVNVAAARELGEFSRASRRLPRVALYSSVFVSGQRAGVIAEDELEADQSFRNGVERSLAIAERLLSNRGVPRVVLRAGHVLSDDPQSPARSLSPAHWVLAFVESAPAETPLPLMPRGAAAFPLTPLEYLAAFGVFAAEHAQEDATFHVMDSVYQDLGSFYELVVRRCGRVLETASPSALSRVLFGNPALRLVPQQLRRILEASASSARYATDHAAALRAVGAPACPNLEIQVDRLLAQLRDPERHETHVAVRPSQAAFLVD
jgi:thioester reductase-like protein